MIYDLLKEKKLYPVWENLKYIHIRFVTVTETIRHNITLECVIFLYMRQEICYNFFCNVMNRRSFGLFSYS